MNARSNTGRELFSGSRFEIPIYQREYAWERDNYEILWEDLRGGLEQGEYFLGLIILTSPPGRSKEVVDGQQRIITISLLAAALRDRCTRDRRPSLATEIERDFLVTLETEDEEHPDERVPRIEFASEDDARVFLSIVEQSIDPDDRGHPMVDAYELFADSLNEDLGEKGFRRLGEWARFLQEGLYFAVFTHPDPSSAFTVFEVVNTRGRDLGHADLIKNSLLAVTTQDERVEVYQRWIGIASQFEDYVDGAFVQFIRHVAMLRRGYIFPKDLHRRVTKDEERNRLPELLADMERHLDYYLQITDPALGGPASEDSSCVFASFNALAVSAVRPLLLALGPNADVAIADTLRLTVRMAAVGSLGSANLERRFSEAADAVTASSKTWMVGLEGVSPDRDTFVTDLPRRRLRKSVLLLLLRSIAQETLLVDRIGHLQLIRPAVAPRWDGFEDEEFAVVGGTIGNAALTDIGRRPRDSKDWESVKAGLVPRVIDDVHKRRLQRQREWTPTRVRRLGSELAERAADVWY